MNKWEKRTDETRRGEKKERGSRETLEQKQHECFNLSNNLAQEKSLSWEITLIPVFGALSWIFHGSISQMLVLMQRSSWRPQFIHQKLKELRLGLELMIIRKSLGCLKVSRSSWLVLSTSSHHFFSPTTKAFTFTKQWKAVESLQWQTSQMADLMIHCVYLTASVVFVFSRVVSLNILSQLLTLDRAWGHTWCYFTGCHREDSELADMSVKNIRLVNDWRWIL